MVKDAHCRLCGSDIENLTTLHCQCSKFRYQRIIHASLGLDISTDDGLHSDMICRNMKLSEKMREMEESKKKKKKKKKKNHLFQNIRIHNVFRQDHINCFFIVLQ